MGFQRGTAPVSEPRADDSTVLSIVVATRAPAVGSLLCDVCRRSIFVDGVLAIVSSLQLRRHGRLPPFGIRMFLNLIGGKDGHSIAAFSDPTALLIRVTAFGTKVLRGRVIASAVNLVARVSGRINVDHIAVVVRLLHRRLVAE